MPISFIIPCYNEEPDVLKNTINGISSLFSRTDLEGSEIIVVDDGSSNTDYQDFPYDRAQLVVHKRNRGYGASLKTGIHAAKHEWVAITDADNTYPPENFLLLLPFMEKNDMIIGARSWSSIEAFRRPAKLAITALASFLADFKIPDLNSGMRIFKRRIYEDYQRYYPNAFSFSSTLTMVSLTNIFDVHFEPIQYLPRIGESSIKPIRDTARFITQLLRLTLYFRPLRFFFPLSLGLLTLAIARGLRDVLLVSHIGGLATLLFFMAFQVFFFGLLAEIINKK